MPENLVDVPCSVCGSCQRKPACLRVPIDPLAKRLGASGGRSSWVVCEGCGLVYQSPRPGPGVYADMYEGGGYHAATGGVSQDYVAYSLRRSRAAIAWGLIQGHLEGTRGRALDIGCGVGGAMLALRERQWDVVGVEPDPALSAHGREAFALDIRTGLFGPEAVAALAAFDLVFASHVWEHLPDPVETSSHAFDALRDGGFLLLVVPTFRASRTYAWHGFKSPHNYMFTDVSLGNVLAIAGFTLVAQRFYHGADSELWMLARADRSSLRTRIDYRREALGRVQRDLVTVPFRIPLGLPGRACTHMRTLVADPVDFSRRLLRWSRHKFSRVARQP